jgi:hypothetical protein
MLGEEHRRCQRPERGNAEGEQRVAALHRQVDLGAERRVLDQEQIGFTRRPAFDRLPLTWGYSSIALPPSISTPGAIHPPTVPRPRWALAVCRWLRDPSSVSKPSMDAGGGLIPCW